MKSPSGIGFELLEYISPTDGEDMPIDTKANDLWHYQTVVAVSDLETLTRQLRSLPCSFISPGIVEMSANELGIKKALAIKDLDGHVLHLIEE